MSRIQVSWAQLIVPMTVVRYFEFPTGGIVLGGGTRTVKYHTVRPDECGFTYRCAIPETDQFCTSGRLIWSRESPSDKNTYALVSAPVACRNNYQYPRDELFEEPLRLPTLSGEQPKERLVPNITPKKTELTNNGLASVAQSYVRSFSEVDTSVVPNTTVTVPIFERTTIELPSVGGAALPAKTTFTQRISTKDVRMPPIPVREVPRLVRTPIQLREFSGSRSPSTRRTSAMVAKITAA